MRASAVLRTFRVLLVCLLFPCVAFAQTDFESKHFTTSDGVKLHYLEAGEGPLLVFVPGWTMPAWIWQAQLDYFATTHRVVALDPRGHGSSEKPTYGYTGTRRAQDIRELLDHLNDEPAVLIGWSGAGKHVLMCADEASTDVVRAVVVVDWDVIREVDRGFAADRIAGVQEDRPAYTRAFVEAIHRDPDPEYVEALTETALAVPMNVAAMSVANMFFFGPHDLSPILERLDRPVLLVFSALEWAVTAAEQARTSWPGMPVEVIEETSHALFVDQPEAFNRVLDSFLTSLAEYRRPSADTSGG